MQFHFLLPKRLAEQLKWSRCVNTRGVIGGNIPADLHLEHLNRHLKDMLSNLRSNITTKAIDHASRSLGIVHHVCEVFEHENNAKQPSGKHTHPVFTKGCNMICEVLKDQKTFYEHDCHCPPSLSYVKTLIQECPTTFLEAWIPKKINCYRW